MPVENKKVPDELYDKAFPSRTTDEELNADYSEDDAAEFAKLEEELIASLK